MLAENKDEGFGDEREPANMRLACIGVFSRAQSEWAELFQEALTMYLEETRVRNAPIKPDEQSMRSWYANDAGGRTEKRPWGLIFSDELELTWPADSKETPSLVNFFKHNLEHLQRIEGIIRAGPRSLVLSSGAVTAEKKKQQQALSSAAAAPSKKRPRGTNGMATGQFDGFMFCLPEINAKDTGTWLAQASLVMDNYYPKPHRTEFKAFVRANSNGMGKLVEMCDATASAAKSLQTSVSTFDPAIDDLKRIVNLTANAKERMEVREQFSRDWRDRTNVFLNLKNWGFTDSKETTLQVVEDVLKAADTPDTLDAAWFLRQLRRALLQEETTLADVPSLSSYDLRTQHDDANKDIFCIFAFAFIRKLLLAHANVGWRTRCWVYSWASPGLWVNHSSWVPSIPDPERLFDHEVFAGYPSMPDLAKAIYKVHRESAVRKMVAYFGPELSQLLDNNKNQSPQEKRLKHDATEGKKAKAKKDAEDEGWTVYPRPGPTTYSTIPLVMGFVQGKYRV
jgi:hypothetical protein